VTRSGLFLAVFDAHAAETVTEDAARFIFL